MASGLVPGGHPAGPGPPQESEAMNFCRLLSVLLDPGPWARGGPSVKTLSSPTAPPVVALCVDMAVCVRRARSFKLLVHE